jgi:hypothetical protein
MKVLDSFPVEGFRTHWEADDAKLVWISDYKPKTTWNVVI